MDEKNTKNKKQSTQSDLVTKESLCAVCALFSAIAFFILCTRALVFGEIGFAVHAFLTGVFGYMSYPLTLGAVYLCVMGLLGKRLVKNRKAGWCIALTVVFAALTVQVATTFSWGLDSYISQCFEAGKNFPAATACGWLGGMLAWLIMTATTKVGAIIVFALGTLFFGYVSYLTSRVENASTAKKNKKDKQAQLQPQPTEIPLTVPTQAPIQQAYDEVVAGQAQPSFASEERVFHEPVSQRPAFSMDNQPPMQDEPTGPVGSSFSPFGTPQTMRPQEQVSREPMQNTREFLFGSTPAENYQRNLIFDPNANVNKRSLATPTPAPVVSESAPSYASAYEDAVNQTPTRPTMIFSDRTQETAQNNYEGNYENNYENNYAQEERSNIQPLSPLNVEPITPQQPVSYPSIDEERIAERDFDARAEETDEEQTDFLRTGDSERRHDYMDLFSPSNPNVFGDSSEDRAFAEETFSRRGEERDILDERVETSRETFLSDPSEREFSRFERESEDESRRGIDIFDSQERNVDDTDDAYSLRSEVEDTPRRMGFLEETESDRRFTIDEPKEKPMEKKAEPPRKEEPAPAPPPKPRIVRPYVRVPIDDFDCRDVEPTQNPEEVEETKENIINTLEDFKVSGASIASVTFGPTVTRYNVAIPRTIPPRKVVALDQSIAISLHSSGVNIYPNYEDGVVSIEVPNKERQSVQLGCMLTGDTFVNAKSSSIMFAMGKDVANRKVYGDISKMTHLLVAGSSGSGKSVFLGSLIISLIYKYSPEELRLILIDPKKTEFVLYNNLPHLMINEIITDVNKSVQSLNWAIGEMNRRYSLFEQMSRAGTYVVNLDQYNAQLKKEERLPKIVIIIDELADLMLAAKKDIEDRIQNLTQKARAAGIHLVVATQRPSTDVITGVIKSNLATRIAFTVATDVDSRVILDQTGAQKLLGKGDFLYTMQGINTPVRVQSAFISSEDSQKVVNFIKANNEAYYDENATAFINNARSGGGGGGDFGGNEEVEPVYIDALRYVILSESASISMIQRKCSVGYNKAGKIVEWMEDMGYISSFDGMKARKVLITKEEFESKYGSL